MSPEMILVAGIFGLFCILCLVLLFILKEIETKNKAILKMQERLFERIDKIDKQED